MTNPSIAGIILAAGIGSRMGHTKQLLDYKGKPILAHVLDHCFQTDLNPLILVLGNQAENIKTTLEKIGYLNSPVKTIVNPAYASGMASSIRAGIKTLESFENKVRQPLAGTLFLLGDQPGIFPYLIQAILDKAGAFPDSIIIPEFKGKSGNPVYFGKPFFNALKQISGDQGGRVLFKQYPEKIIRFHSPADAVCWDLDTPEDYERLCRQKEIQ